MKTVIGIDPGLVHSGLVVFQFNEEDQEYSMLYEVLDGLDAEGAAAVCARYPDAKVFIEDYRARSHYDTDARMIAGVSKFKHAIPGSVLLNNTGVKQVVTQELMDALDVWTFKAVTHHQDLRSAARIGLYGAFKDPELNWLLYQIIVDFHNSQRWTRL